MNTVIHKSFYVPRKQLKCNNCIYYRDNGKCGLFMFAPPPPTNFEVNNVVNDLYIETKYCRKYQDLCGPYAAYFKSKD